MKTRALIAFERAMVGINNGIEQTHNSSRHQAGGCLFSSLAPSIAFRSAGTCWSSFSNLMPVRLSITGGNWLMIWVTSAVILLAQPPGPPPLIITIFSVLDRSEERRV